MSSEKNQATVIMWIGIAATVLSPIILSLPSPNCRIWRSFSTDTGVIGDTIGGLTAPVIGIISILLLYRTLTSQLSFNEEQAGANISQQLIQSLSNLYSLDSRLDLSYTLNGIGVQMQVTGIANIQSLRMFPKDSAPLINMQSARSLNKQLKVIATQCDIINRYAETNIPQFREYQVIAKQYLQMIQKITEDIHEQHYNLLANSPEDVHSDGTLPSEVQNVIDASRSLHEEVNTIIRNMREA